MIKVTILRLIISLMLFFMMPVFADTVYRWLTGDGTVVYGDNPPAEAKIETVELYGISVINPPSEKKASASNTLIVATPKKPTKQVQKNITLPILEILSPEDKAVIRANNGSIMLQLNAKPPLLTTQNFIVYLNGKQRLTARSEQIELKNLNRGEHRLFVVIQNQAGDILSSSPNIHFQMLRVAK